MSKIVDVIKRTLKKYQGRKVNCPCAYHGSACDATVLGSFIKSMINDNAWPIPEPPYKNFTLADFRFIFGLIDIKTLCNQVPDCCQSLLPKDHGVLTSINRNVNDILGKVTGLDIKNFKR
jgi:hypothetical protein